MLIANRETLFSDTITDTISDLSELPMRYETLVFIGTFRQTWGHTPYSFGKLIFLEFCQ